MGGAVSEVTDAIGITDSSPTPTPAPSPSCAQSGTVQDSSYTTGNSNIMWYDRAYSYDTNGPHRCSYDLSKTILSGLSANSEVGATPYGDMVDRICANTANIAFSLPGNAGMCSEQNTAIQLAKDYCGNLDTIITDTNICNPNKIPGGQPTYNTLLGEYCTRNPEHLADSSHACSTLSLLNEPLYQTLSTQFCEQNPDSEFCSCYNVVEDKCADDSVSGVAGCNHPSGSSYVKNRQATPEEYKPQWDGQRQCGSVCSGAGKYLPPNNQAGCKTTIQICSQDINVQTATDSEINATCELNAEGSGGGGGGGGGDEDEDGGGLTAYFPKSFDGLKTDRKQQAGAAGVGGSFMSICMLILLIVVSAGAGGGAGPTRFR